MNRNAKKIFLQFFKTYIKKLEDYLFCVLFLFPLKFVLFWIIAMLTGPKYVHEKMMESQMSVKCSYLGG